jgi:hypothetical protein
MLAFEVTRVIIQRSLATVETSEVHDLEYVMEAEKWMQIGSEQCVEELVLHNRILPFLD